MQTHDMEAKFDMREHVLAGGRKHTAPLISPETWKSMLHTIFHLRFG